MTRLILKILFIVVIFSVASYADIVNPADAIMTKFNDQTKAWRDVIAPTALSLFYMFMTIDIVIDSTGMILKQADLGDWTLMLVKKIMIFGFFLFLFNNADMLGSIPQSFDTMGTRAAGMDITPDKVLSLGVGICVDLLSSLSLNPLNIGDSLLKVLGGLLLLVCFALSAAQLLLTYVKTWIIVAFSPLIFSLGALGHTRQTGFGPLISIAKAGMELMLLKICIATAYNMVSPFAQGIETSMSGLLVMCGTMILLLGVIYSVNSIVESLWSGGSAVMSSSGVEVARAAGASIGGAAVGAASLGVAAKTANDLAKEQRSAGDSGASAFRNLKEAYSSKAFSHTAAGSLREKLAAQKSINESR